jgi:hypothetical protein
MNKQDKTRLPPTIKNVPSISKNPMVDVFLTYQFIKRLLLPFKEWDAYKLGIIDEKGKVLKKRKDLKTPEEKASWGYFDILTTNLKKLLSKAPGGDTLIASSVASYLLLKENKSDKLLDEKYFEEKFYKTLHELAEEGEVPANNVGGGDVKGFDPLLIKKVKKILRRKMPNVDT